eukprot:TRINITY_DN13219_c0_g1_i1.p1 TRINITY_DN13219_c0_g1~~TRINITY_DN13219_c0_g1_i1.p1  ORF type:complete len:700 (+),score=85.47 TRINITY_DN13219_c0_g1_i1:68-2167(+)
MNRQTTWLLLILITVCFSVTVMGDTLAVYSSTLAEGRFSGQTVIFAEQGSVFLFFHNQFIVRYWAGTEVARVPIKEVVAAAIADDLLVIFTGSSIQMCDKYSLKLVSTIPSVPVTTLDKVTILKDTYIAGRVGGSFRPDSPQQPSNLNTFEGRAVLSMVHPTADSAGGGPSCVPPSLQNSVFDGSYLVSLEYGGVTIYNVSSTCEVTQIARDDFNILFTSVLELSLGGKNQVALILRYDGGDEPLYVAGFLGTSKFPQVETTFISLSDKLSFLGEIAEDELRQQLKYLRLSYYQKRLTIISNKYLQIWERSKEKQDWDMAFSQYQYFPVHGLGNSTFLSFAGIGHETIKTTFGDGGMLARLYILEEKTCTKSGSREYPRSLHPTQLAFFGSQSVGLLVFSTIVTSTLCLALYLVEVITHNLIKVDFPLKAPSSMLFIIENVYQLFTLSAIIILVYPFEGGWGSFSLAEQLLAPCALFVFLASLGIPRYVYTTVIGGVVFNKKAVLVYEDPSLYHSRNILLRILIGPSQWIPTVSNERNWVDQHSCVLSRLNQDGVWYCAVDFMVTLVITVFVSWRADTDVACGIVKLANCILLVSLTVVQLTYQPFSLPRSNVYYPLMNAAQSIGLVCRATSLFLGDVDHQVNDVGSVIFSICEKVSYCKIAADIIAGIYKWKTNRTDTVTRQAWLELKKASNTNTTCT